MIYGQESVHTRAPCLWVGECYDFCGWSGLLDCREPNFSFDSLKVQLPSTDGVVCWPSLELWHFGKLSEHETHLLICCVSRSVLRRYALGLIFYTFSLVSRVAGACGVWMRPLIFMTGAALPWIIWPEPRAYTPRVSGLLTGYSETYVRAPSWWHENRTLLTSLSNPLAESSGPDFLDYYSWK